MDTVLQIGSLWSTLHMACGGHDKATIRAFLGKEDAAALLNRRSCIEGCPHTAKYATTPLHQLIGRAHHRRPNGPAQAEAVYTVDLDLVGEVLAVEGLRLDVRDCRGRTPLHVAAMCGEVGAIELLLQAGADADARDDAGDTPADLADADQSTPETARRVRAALRR